MKITDDCMGCSQCGDICPHDAIRFGQYSAKIIKDRCQDCGACLMIDCPGDAIVREK